MDWWLQNFANAINIALTASQYVSLHAHKQREAKRLMAIAAEQAQLARANPDPNPNPSPSPNPNPNLNPSHSLDPNGLRPRPSLRPSHVWSRRRPRPPACEAVMDGWVMSAIDRVKLFTGRYKGVLCADLLRAHVRILL